MAGRGAQMLLFFRTMFAMLLAEMGDKTQLLSATLAAKYRVRHVIIGIGLAILALNGMAIVLGAALGQMLPLGWLKLFAGGAFFLFALQAFAFAPGKNDQEDPHEIRQNKGPVSAVFMTFFLAELGDKTQLTAITFAANEGGGFQTSLCVWLACCVGLFLADLFGMIVGFVLNSHLPARVMQVGSCVVFAGFGAVTIWQGVNLLFSDVHMAQLVTVSALLYFVLLCVLCGMYVRARERRRRIL